MIMSNFFDAQALCEYTFSKLGPCWHLYTPDNCPIIFTTIEEYKAGMSLFAIAALMCPKVKVLTFELMSNHLHATLCGSKEDIEAFFRLFRSMLLKYLRSQGRTLPDSFEMSLRLIESLDDLRNVLVYNNRNGFLVRPEYSPFSYPFGANSYYFNPFAKEYYANCRTKIKTKDLENLAHTHSVRDIENPIYMLDGYICPLCFCDIETGEKLFRDASHYFYSLSRNIEGQKKIAQEIGDRVFYNDDELYSVVATISSKKYGLPPAQLPSDAKVELAKTLHYDYNASNKAIIRMLRLDPNIVNSLFPARN